jgi:hypothetical protein
VKGIKKIALKPTKDEFVNAVSGKSGIMILFFNKTTQTLISCFTRANLKFKPKLPSQGFMDRSAYLANVTDEVVYRFKGDDDSVCSVATYLNDKYSCLHFIDNPLSKESDFVMTSGSHYTTANCFPGRTAY